MKIIVLGNQPNWSMTELAAAAGARHQIEFVEWRRLLGRLGGQEFAGADDVVPDSVIVRGMPVGSLEQVIFQMNLLARIARIGVTVINSPRGLEIAIDKYLTLACLSQSGLPVPETIICQQFEDAMNAFEQLGADTVVKPVFGGEGRGIVRVTDLDLAHRTFRAILNLGGIVYQQKFIRHAGFDTRLLVVGDEVFAMRRHNVNDWRTNASRGADCRAWEATESEKEMALRSASATFSTIAGVDLLYDLDGNPYIIEVNGVPGWQRIAKATGVNIAARIISLIESTCRIETVRLVEQRTLLK